MFGGGLGGGDLIRFKVSDIQVGVFFCRFGRDFLIGPKSKPDKRSLEGASIGADWKIKRSLESASIGADWKTIRYAHIGVV